PHTKTKPPSLHPIRASPPPLLMTTPNLICPTLSATIFNSLLDATKNTVREVDASLLNKLSPSHREDFKQSLAALLQQH
ncbi:MAG: hypothetical protein ACI9XZ_004647, partial [Alphaproteobacteria bacterium]